MRTIAPLLALSRLATAAVALALLAGAAQAQPAKPPPPSCFFVSDWNGWRAADARTIYLRVGASSIYRLDLANSCPGLLWPDARLISNVRGPPSICTPLDLDLKVSNGQGIVEPCIVKSMRRLTPAEAAAVPRNLRP